MTAPRVQQQCDQADLVCAYALHVLPAAEVSAVEEHISRCAECQRELQALRSTIDSFAGWPTEVLRPAPSLWERVARRVAAEAGTPPLLQPERQWVEPAWEDVAPGISCKLLATDESRSRVAMLVRLGPGVDYPPHEHAGVEELHLLQGELWINERKLFPGDYNRAEPGTSDSRVWSETGCTCVLITSPADILRA